jgi:hypothetical protein
MVTDSGGDLQEGEAMRLRGAAGGLQGVCGAAKEGLETQCTTSRDCRVELDIYDRIMVSFDFKIEAYSFN